MARQQGRSPKWMLPLQVRALQQNTRGLLSEGAGLRDNILQISRAQQKLTKLYSHFLMRTYSNKPIMSPPDCKKLNVILDIDETLVYFINKKYWKHSWDLLSDEEKAKYTVKPNNSGVFIIRPHLPKFLSFLFKHCNVSLWTLSDEEYAEGVAKMFVSSKSPRQSERKSPHQSPHRKHKLQHILNGDEHAELAGDLHGNNKDLNWLWYHSGYDCFAECNTILIDDLPANSINPSNRQNSITINPFALFGEVKDRSKPYLDVSEDDTLLKIIELLKIVMKQQHNCAEGDGRWDNIFSEDSIEKMGLESYLHSMTFRGKRIKSICVGDMNHMGGRRKAKAAHRKAKP